MNDKEYSMNFALKQLEPIISKLKIEINDLEGAIKAANKPNNSLVIAYNQKKSLYDALVSRQKKLMESSDSYSQSPEKKHFWISHRDEKLKKLDSKIAALSANKFSSYSKNEDVLRAKKRFDRQLDRLEMKSARMLVRQRSAVKRKLAKEIKRLDREQKFRGLLEAREKLDELHNDNKNMHINRTRDLAASNNIIDKTFRTANEGIKVATSWINLQSMKAYTSVLKVKQGIALGAKKARNIQEEFKGMSR